MDRFAKWILASYQKEGNEKICCAIMEALTEVYFCFSHFLLRLIYFLIPPQMLKMNEHIPRLKNIDSVIFYFNLKFLDEQN